MRLTAVLLETATIYIANMLLKIVPCHIAFTKKSGIQSFYQPLTPL
jgi:hypothetical protein